MRHFSLAFVALVSISASMLAQCSTLTVSGSINAGQTITVDVSGAPANSLVMLAIGDAGTTTIPIPMMPLVLGVTNFVILPIGQADANGHALISVSVPANIPANVIQNHTFTVQSVSLALPSFTPGSMPSLSFCVSNTASLVSGTG